MMHNKGILHDGAAEKDDTEQHLHNSGLSIPHFL